MLVADYDTKISEIENKVSDHDDDKYITTSEFNNLTTNNFTERLAQANLVAKTDSYNKLTSLDRKINSNKTRHLLVENELKKFQTFDSIYFRAKNYFGGDGSQNYLVFQPMHIYFKKLGDSNYISE